MSSFPLSPERETCCILSVNQLLHACLLTKWKKCNILSLFLQIHIVESTIHHSLMRTVHPFFQERSCILHFPFWRNFSILSFYKQYSSSPLVKQHVLHRLEPKACRPMSLGSYRLESRRDLRTANIVCGFSVYSMANSLIVKIKA